MPADLLDDLTIDLRDTLLRTEPDDDRDLRFGVELWAICFVPAMALLAATGRVGDDGTLAWIAALFLVPLSVGSFSVIGLFRQGRWIRRAAAVGLAFLAGCTVLVAVQPPLVAYVAGAVLLVAVGALTERHRADLDDPMLVAGIVMLSVVAMLGLVELAQPSAALAAG